MADATVFNYTARTKAGALTKGQLSAIDRSAALAAIARQGLVPVLVKESGGKGLNMNLSSLPGLKSLQNRQKVKLKEKVIFTRQFATMINAGVPIAQSLAILQKQTSSEKFRSVIGGMMKKVEGGTPLSVAMAEHGEVFPPVYVNMVKAGEAGGILDEVLDRLAIQQEKDADLISKVKGASIYPAVITTAALAAFIFLMTVIVPKLSVIFDQLGGNLPWYTKIMLNVSHFMTRFSVFIIAGLVAAAIALVRWKKTARGKKILDTIALKSPIVGAIIVKVNIARFARTFGSLMSSGLAVLDALHITSQALGNTLFKEELEQVAVEVKNGRPVSDVLKRSHNFPPIVAQMISVGEETGQIDKILLKVAEFYEKEVDATVSNLTSVIEPVLIIVLGFMVGSIVLSVFGPISQLTDQVSQS